MTTELRLLPENKPTDRFQLTEKPMVSPAKCACCGAVDRPVIDFDMTVQFYGAVLLCITCLAEASRLIGMVHGVELEKAEVSATQSLSSQLSALGMRTITDEQFSSVYSAVSGLSDILGIIGSELGEAEQQGQDRLFEFDGVDDEGQPRIIEFPDSVPEQKHDDVISKGPDSVSASDGDGADFFTL